MEGHVILATPAKGFLVLGDAHGTGTTVDVLTGLFTNWSPSWTRTAHLVLATFVVRDTSDLVEGDASHGQVVRITVLKTDTADAFGSMITALTVRVGSTLRHSAHICANSESLRTGDADLVVLADGQIVDALVTLAALHQIGRISHGERGQTLARRLALVDGTESVRPT